MSWQKLTLLLLLLSLFLGPRLLFGWWNLRLATRAGQQGDEHAASLALARAAARLPWDGTLWGRAGQAAWRAGEPALAQRWFARGAQRGMLTAEDWLHYGDSLAALGEEEAAILIWQTGVRQVGPSPQLLRRLAAVERQRGNYSAATDLLRQALQVAPEDADLHYELALLLTWRAPEEALDMLMTVLRLDPAREKQIAPLRADLNRALLDEDMAYRLTVIGRGLLAAGQVDLALVALERAVQENGRYAEAWAWLAEARQQAGLEARLQLDVALLYGSHLPAVQALDGLYWMRQDQPERALIAYQRAAALEPENPIWQISLAQAAEAAGLFSQAQAFYWRALELDPTSLPAWQGLAHLSVLSASPTDEVGVQAVRRLMELAPDDWRTWDLAGQIAAIRSLPAEAEAHFQKAILLAPDQPDPHLHLAIFYLDQNMPDLAHHHLQRVCQLDPQGLLGAQAQRILERYFP